MDDISINVLLEFLYSRFAVTFLWCFFGSCAREVFFPNRKKRRMVNLQKIIISTIFSTILMCTIADYIDLTFSAYILLNIICGMWGMIFIQILVNENFVTKLLLKLVDRIPSPTLKDATKSFTDEINKKDEKDESDSNNENEK